MTTTFLLVAKICSPVDGEVADTFVLLLQEFHGEVDAFQAAAGDRQIAGDGGSAGEHDGVEFPQQVIYADICADFGVASEGDAGFFHQFDPAGDDPFFQFEIRDAVAQQSAGFVVAFENRDGMSGCVQLVGGGEAGGA